MGPYAWHVLTLVALVLPLGIDSFAVAAALGIAGLPASQRLRVGLVFAGFEAVMPLVGVGVGHALGAAIGSAAEDVAGLALVGTGLFMLFSKDDDEAGRAMQLARLHGLAVIGLGI